MSSFGGRNSYLLTPRPLGPAALASKVERGQWRGVGHELACWRRRQCWISNRGEVKSGRSAMQLWLENSFLLKQKKGRDKNSDRGGERDFEHVTDKLDLLCVRWELCQFCHSRSGGLDSEGKNSEGKEGLLFRHRLCLRACQRHKIGRGLGTG